MTLQSVDTNIITTHIARLEAEAKAHCARAREDPVFLVYATAAEGGVKALRAVLAEAEARVPHTPAVGHVTDGSPCWCDPETIAVPTTRTAS